MRDVLRSVKELSAGAYMASEYQFQFVRDRLVPFVTRTDRAVALDACSHDSQDAFWGPAIGPAAMNTRIALRYKSRSAIEPQAMHLITQSPTRPLNIGIICGGASSIPCIGVLRSIWHMYNSRRSNPIIVTHLLNARRGYRLSASRGSPTGPIARNQVSTTLETQDPTRAASPSKGTAALTSFLYPKYPTIPGTRATYTNVMRDVRFVHRKYLYRFWIMSVGCDG
jgi:hypothetical protein